MVKFTTLFLLIDILDCYICYGQGSEYTNAEINNIIRELFDGYRAGASARENEVFSPDAQVQTIISSKEKGDGISALKPISEFVSYIGGGLSTVHDERLWDTQIHVDDYLATVWTQNAFFLGDSFSHCGTETLLLGKGNNSWKIFYLVDTRQKVVCKLPAEIINN